MFVLIKSAVAQRSSDSLSSNAAIIDNQVEINPGFPVPVFSHTFRGMIVCIDDNLRLSMKDDLERMIELMGGTLQVHLDGATHLIADRVHSNFEISGRASKFWVAYERGIRICHAGWVEYVLQELWNKPQLGALRADDEVFASGFEFPVFAYLRVCGQFLTAAKQEEILSVVNHNGGLYMEEFDLTRHLRSHDVEVPDIFLIDANATDAVINGALYVSGQATRHLLNDVWISESVRRGICQKFENYTVRRSILNEDPADISDDNFTANFERIVPIRPQSSPGRQEMSAAPRNEANVEHLIEPSFHLAEEPARSHGMEVDEDESPPAQQAPRRRSYSHECNVAGCDKSYQKRDRLQDHMIDAHDRGFAYLCSCGFIATGPSRRNTHEKNCKTFAKDLKPFLIKRRQNDPGTFADYSFKHLNFITVRTTHPRSYPQIKRYSFGSVSEYIVDHIDQLKRNQQRFNRLWADRTREIESDDELHF